jgi:ribulose kinase
MNKEKVVRMTFTLPEGVEKILRKLAAKTGLKMSKIVENGIINEDKR